MIDTAGQQPEPRVPDAPTEKRRGCYLWGCLASVIAILIVTAATGLIAYRFMTGQVRQYTAETAAEIPKVEYSDEELRLLQQRLNQIIDQQGIQSAESAAPPAQDDTSDSLGDNATAGDGSESEPTRQVDAVVDTSPPRPGDLVLSARDINALVSRSPELRGKVFVTIQDGQVGGEVSMPLDKIPGGEGRYFNASATFDVQLRDSQLIVTVKDAAIKGKQAPPIVLDALAGKNLATEINKHPRMKPKLEKFDSLSVIDDTVILRAKSEPKFPSSTASDDLPTPPAVRDSGTTSSTD